MKLCQWTTFSAAALLHSLALVRPCKSKEGMQCSINNNDGNVSSSSTGGYSCKEKEYPNKTQTVSNVDTVDRLEEQQQKITDNVGEDPVEWMSAHCGVILANSSLPHAGWGVFMARATTRGQPIMAGDIVIQINDIPPNAWSLRLPLYIYWWESRNTGGFYEGVHVVSQICGLGMLGNGLSKAGGANVIHFVPRIDEGGLTRLNSPGAGAITHYHNLSWFAMNNLSAGDEVFINYGDNWFDERQQSLKNQGLDSLLITTTLPNKIRQMQDEDTENHGRRPMQQLRREGRCLDAMKPGPSLLPDAGRGAFVRWSVPANAIVSAVPVVPIAKDHLRLRRSKKDTSDSFDGWQLLLNYVLGHEHSSVALITLGPMFSLVNHAPSTITDNPDNNIRSRDPQQPLFTANVRLQWSRSNTLFTARSWLNNTSIMDLLTRNHSGLLLELVATRDIYAGEEIFLDYGPAWQAAWDKHVQQWSPPPNAESYAPSYVHDDAIAQARTEKELQIHPYPEHVFTSCFFPVNATIQERLTKNSGSSHKEVTTFQWQMTRGMFEYHNLRPCRVLERQGTRHKNVFLYTVQILNRYGLRQEERLTSPLVVTHVPRRAIRFTDKIYTTDQHLPNAFRHPIHLRDDVFPDAWKDLAP